VNEHVFAAIIANDEAEALLRVEKFDHAGAFADDLRGHAATAAETTTAAAATKTAAAATAEAVTAATEPVAATAEAVATATEAAATAETVAAAKAAIEATFEAAVTKTIALVAAAPTTFAAAPFIETHALFVFQIRPKSPCKNPSLGRQTQVFRRSTACALIPCISQNLRGCEQIRRVRDT
jgi:hypothetical protein